MLILILKILSTLIGSMVALFSLCLLFDESTHSKSGVVFLITYFVTSTMACWL